MKKLLVLSKYNCGSCDSLKIYLANNDIEHESVNIQDNVDVAVKYGVMSAPVTILLDEQGNEVQRSNGYNPNEIEELAAKVKGE